MANSITSSSFIIRGSEEQIEWLLDLSGLAQEIHWRLDFVGQPDLTEVKEAFERRRRAAGAADPAEGWGELLDAAERLVWPGGKEGEAREPALASRSQPGREVAEALISGDENFDPEYAADLVLAWMERFDLQDPLGFEWSHGCSKMRPGEFGGGACLVLRSGPVWLSTSGWLEEKRKEHQAVLDSALVR